MKNPILLFAFYVLLLCLSQRTLAQNSGQEAISNIHIIGPDIAFRGSEMILTINVNFVGKSYQWYLNDEPIPNANAASYEVENVRILDGGHYKCRIYSGYDLLNKNSYLTATHFVRVADQDPLGGAYLANQIIIQFDEELDSSEIDSIRMLYDAELVKDCQCKLNLQLWKFNRWPNTSIVFENSIGEIMEVIGAEGIIQQVSDPENKPVEIDGILNAGFNYLLDASDDVEETDAIGYLTAHIDESNINVDGSTVRVTLIDTGVKDFENFTPFNPQDVCDPNYLDIEDENGHGTHLAYEITSGLPVDFLELYVLKIFNKNGRGDLFDIACAIYLANSYNNGTDIINCSWGYYGLSSQILENAIMAAIKNRTIFVCSAGNACVNGVAQNGARHYPSSFAGYHDNVFSIGALGKNRNSPSSYSCWDEYTLFAPAENITPCVHPDNPKFKSVKHGFYKHYQPVFEGRTGTSQAAAYVTRSIAILLWNNYQISSTDLNEKIKEQVIPMENIGTEWGGKLDFELDVEFQQICDNESSTGKLIIHNPNRKYLKIKRLDLYEYRDEVLIEYTLPLEESRIEIIDTDGRSFIFSGEVHPPSQLSVNFSVYDYDESSEGYLKADVYNGFGDLYYQWRDSDNVVISEESTIEYTGEESLIFYVADQKGCTVEKSFKAFNVEKIKEYNGIISCAEANRIEVYTLAGAYVTTIEGQNDLCDELWDALVGKGTFALRIFKNNRRTNKLFHGIE